MTGWFSLYTKAGSEDSVTSLLTQSGLVVLNPRIRAKRFVGNRLAERTEPLFPCYIFARFDPEADFRMITYTRGIRYIVGGNSPVSVPEAVIHAIESHATDGIITPAAPKLSRGDRVSITEGPFKHFSAVFDRELKGSERVAILLEAMNARLEIDGSLLKPSEA